MNTTNVFAELLVIGFGAALLVLAAVFVLHPTVLLESMDGLQNLGVVHVIAVVPLVYLLGIIMDRLADWVFKFPERRICRVSESQKEIARTELLESSDWVAQKYEYNRNRQRICRGSFLNIVLLLLIVPFFPWEVHTRLELGVGLAILAISCFSAWYSLFHKEMKKLGLLARL